jgi:Spy/CpxP family protein refolding chaperone
MKALALLTACLVGLSSLSGLSAAEKTKSKDPDVASYPFWTLKKRGLVPQLVPGLNAVLQLTASQKEQIGAARDAMANDEAVKAARGISKNDPSVTAEQRDKARAAVDAAMAKLQEKVATILTTEQKVLIEKVNAAYAAAVEDTGIVYADKFASVKADEAARRRIQEDKAQDIEEQFLHKLNAILTASQKEAMTNAAAEGEQRNAKAATIKKPVK